MKTAKSSPRVKKASQRQRTLRQRHLSYEWLERRELFALVSIWSAENTAIDPISGNNGTLYNGATYAAGQVGKAFSFDGVNDRISVPDSPSFKLTESLSIEAWIKVDALPTDTRPGTILFRGDDRGGLDPYVLRVDPNGELTFHIRSLTERCTLSAPIATGQFVHVAAVLDDTTGNMQLYQNGALVAELVTNVRPFADLDPTRNPGVGIGNHSGYPGTTINYPFYGQIDELKLYNHALTSAEVQANFNTKFYVVDDGSSDRTYEYAASGNAIEKYSLGSGNTAPRGAASNLSGDRVWVVDANKNVYVYNDAGGLLGSWTAGSLPRNATVEGIATDGVDVWLVDARADRVYRYPDAASRLSGSQNAASNFALNSGNLSPKDIVTDGVHLWVVNDSTTDKVFKYTMTGALVGSWNIGSDNSKPTGITIDPSGASQSIWIVDNGTDRVYEYANSRGRDSGSQTAELSFVLAAGNGNPQGIADPPRPSTLATNTSTVTSSIRDLVFPMVDTFETQTGLFGSKDRMATNQWPQDESSVYSFDLAPATTTPANWLPVATVAKPSIAKPSASFAIRDEAFADFDFELLDQLVSG